MNEADRSRATETIDERYAKLDAWPLERIIEAIVDSNAGAVAAVATAQPQLSTAAAAIAQRLAAGGRLAYVGAGTSGRLALQDAAELLPTFGFDRTLVLLAGGVEAGARAREGAEDDEGEARAEVERQEIARSDVLIGVAASGRTPYTVAAVRAARETGALTVGIANNPNTPLLEAAEHPVCLETGPEVLAGSTRLAAGTAQKVALNALSTAVLVKLGGAYGNLMVGMVPTNEKLKGRAVKIVQLATGSSREQAQEALRSANSSIAAAIVMIEADVPANVAHELLEVSAGRVREALATDSRY